MNLSRRSFLHSMGAFSLGFSGLHTLMARSAFASPRNVADGFGPLKADPDGLLDLPEGFSYRIIGRAGKEMKDGFIVPAKADGMAAFAVDEHRTLLIRNHENNHKPPSEGAFGAHNQLVERVPREKFFDAGEGKFPGLGGTTSFIYNTHTGDVEDDWLSLAGTLRNCAGGPTPWNTWISCEETVIGKEDVLEQMHGYNFEVPASREAGLVTPEPLKAMGRFNHEAIAVHPALGIVYQTEDREDSLIYRFIPNTPRKLVDGGRLEALVIVDQPSRDTRNWETGNRLALGATLPVAWIEMDDVESPEDNLRYRGFEGGAARFARGEGMWTGKDGIYFACTSGGHARKGQIWRYVPSPFEGTEKEADAPGALELLVEPNDGGLIENADNLTVAPWGDLIVCEDGSGENYLVGVTPKGGIYKFARNAQNDSELAGATFSPDGSTLFVNIQENGFTVAITGPWKKA